MSEAAGSDSGLPGTPGVFSCTSLNFQYPDYSGLAGRPLFNDLSYSPASRRINVILGGADRGKTTLARIFMGLVPLYTGGVLTGEIRWDGVPVAEIPVLKMMQTAGLVFQDPEEEILSPRCDQEIAFALESAGLPPDEISRKVADALEWAGLAGFEHRNPASLSGGEQKRLLTAALRAQDPTVWILDELFEELDELFRLKVLEYLVSAGKTVIVFASKYHEIFSEFQPVLNLLEEGGIRPPGGADVQRLLADKGYTFVRGEDRKERGEGPGAQGVAGEILIRAENLQFSYPAGAFSIGLTELTLRKGETIAFLGGNGSGKSTLAKILCGLLTPGSGSISRPGKGGEPAFPFQSLTPDELRRQCGYLFQNPDYQLFLPTIREELLYGFSASEKRRLAERAEESRRLFELPAGEAPPSLLGYGTRRKLQGAVAYLQQRSLLILDEGDSGLDYSDFTGMVDRLRNPERCLILISHQREAVRDFADRIFTFSGGRVVEEKKRGGTG